MWLLPVVFLGACGWWEQRQACKSARADETSAWTAMRDTLAGAEDASAKTSEAGAEAAQGMESAVAPAVAGAPTAEPYNLAEMAQDAYTRASRLGGDAKKAEEDARWADYTLRTEAAAAEADRLAERAGREVESLAAWREAYGQAALALTLSAARYRLVARDADEEVWPTITLSLAASRDLPAPAPDAVVAQGAMTAVEARRAALEERRGQFSGVLERAERLAFDTDRAGQIATTRARDIDFLDLPTSAQVARAAAMTALAAGGRAASAAQRLKATAAEHKALYESGEVPVPEHVGNALGAAREASGRVAELCQ